MDQGTSEKDLSQVTRGSKVVCVDDKFPTEILTFYKGLPIKDKVYTIRDMGIGVTLQGEHGEVVVYLQELHNPKSSTPPYPERGFAQWRFREIKPAEDLEQVEELAESFA